MKKGILSSVIFLSCIIGLSSCLDDGDDYAEYYNSNAVVNYNSSENKTTLLALNTELLIQDGDIDAAYLEPGTCLQIDYIKIDKENQPSKKYYTINQLSGVKKLGKKAVQTETEMVIGEYKLPIVNIALDIQSVQKGIIFGLLRHKDVNADYKMVYIPQKEENERTIKNVYLVAKSTETTTNSDEKYEKVAFDVNDLFAQSIDTVIDDASYKHIKVKLHHLTKELDEKDEKIDWNSKTIEINILE